MMNNINDDLNHDDTRLLLRISNNMNSFLELTYCQEIILQNIVISNSSFGSDNLFMSVS